MVVPLYFMDCVHLWMNFLPLWNSPWCSCPFIPHCATYLWSTSTESSFWPVHEHVLWQLLIFLLCYCCSTWFFTKTDFSSRDECICWDYNYVRVNPSFGSLHFFPSPERRRYSQTQREVLTLFLACGDSSRDVKFCPPSPNFFGEICNSGPAVENWSQYVFALHSAFQTWMNSA